ncbi:bile acid:sodium symporter family protein [Streptacidiphilus rugosus]|uniref:bile acid:sodium symporter family protein n=1 Tax=Streptacidiphilus rugosus TaxID=405783 RepID=UPI00068C642C|nr:bile acid:sodium symporter family protein [Streptacidiphilus rugosus]
MNAPRSTPTTDLRTALGRVGVDPFLLAILATVGLAALFPAEGGGAHAVSVATRVAIGLLFFLYGARLSPKAALDGARQWRLHLAVLLATFALFPLLGVLAQWLTTPLLGASLAKGVLFLTLLPSTVQSSIAFTSIAGGNVAAAVCAASFSSLVGIALTPLLTAWLMGGSAHVDAGSALDLVLQLLLPFLLGQLSRRWIAGWTTRHRPALSLVDRGSILLVVYGAFSEGMVDGVWSALSPARLAVLLGTCVALLFAVLGITATAGRRLGFRRADRIVLIFCGSKKSLATGLPMAAVLFPPASVSLLVLPLMLFHQIQLMACTVIARRMAPQGREELRDKPPA